MHETSNSPGSNQTVQLPILVETIFAFSKLLITLPGIFVIVISLNKGNPYWVAMIRGGVTVLSLGILVWFISWLSVKGIVESARGMLKEAQENENHFSGVSMDTKA